MNNSDGVPELAFGFLWTKGAVGLFWFAELALTALFLVLAFKAPHLGSRWFERMEARFAGLAGHPVRQIVAVGVFAVLARAAVLPWLGAPVAYIYDEQSMVLQAQTFMAGRLANPPHPFWEHFETFYVNQLPAYASMYFPGRGAPLYAGLLIAGNAWVGVWLSVVLMCMAATWMLQGWVSLPMAFLGGVLVAVRLGIFSFWTNSYYGGAFTAFGAMLVFGALARVLKEPRWRDGLVMGLGAAILMVSRPYEGMLLCLPVAIAVLVRWLRPGWKGGRWAIAKLALPALLLLGAGGGLLLSYNKAATGDFLKDAYRLNRETYASAPAFLVSPPVVSQNRGPAHMRAYFEREAQPYHYRESAAKLVRSVGAKLLHTWNFYIGPTFTLAFVAGLWVARRDRLLVGTLVFFMLGYFLETWNFPQYTAPLYPVLLVLTMRGFAWLRTRSARGLFLTRAMPAAAIALLALPVSFLVLGWPPLGDPSAQAACCVVDYDKLRPALERQLAASPGRDLVLVKDGPHYPTHYELVYNEADIDNAQVVWARRLSAEKDQRLVSHFSDRLVWEFEWLPKTPGAKQAYRFTPITPDGKPQALRQ
ncbi:MAG: putative rane protein [Polaromonas sp.]|nr:putative rane protein [Polaromonas sp.]